jgi:sugar phosphate isomerase/epimerase
MDRRAFLKAGLAGVAAAYGVSRPVPKALAAQGEGNRMEAVLRISSQEWLVPGNSLRDKVLRLQDWGAVGVELGGGNLPGRVAEIEEALAGTDVKISAICAGYEGVPISPDSAVRAQCVQSMRDILSAAGDLGSTGLIVVPAFNHHEQLAPKEGRQVLIDMMRDVGDHAQEHGTRVLLEPLNRGEAFFLRQLADAASICRDTDNPGVGMMGDFYHMHIEETSDMGAFLSAGPWLHHVHLASRRRKLPGQDDRSFVDGFRGLKMVGYQDFCSLECGIEGEAEAEMPKSFDLLRRQWAEATV